MSARKIVTRKGAKAPKPGTMRIFQTSQVLPVTETWPKFETVILRATCCQHCGHPIEEPRAGAIMVCDFDVMPDIASPLFKRREREAQAAAMKAWLRSTAGKAWLRLKAKPSLATYRAAKAAGGAK